MQTFAFLEKYKWCQRVFYRMYMTPTVQTISAFDLCSQVSIISDSGTEEGEGANKLPNHEADIEMRRAWVISKKQQLCLADSFQCY